MVLKFISLIPPDTAIQPFSFRVNEDTMQAQSHSSFKDSQSIHIQLSKDSIERRTSTARNRKEDPLLSRAPGAPRWGCRVCHCRWILKSRYQRFPNLALALIDHDLKLSEGAVGRCERTFEMVLSSQWPIEPNRNITFRNHVFGQSPQTEVPIWLLK